MPSDYKVISKHNERQLGLDTKSRQTQISMYSDPTHFVYEILQNADDYGATEILFRLSENALLIEHNGEPFTEDNVKSITYFGKSTSRDDLVKTGRFGVGFKSVFAFTATPIIISGDEHFQIYGLYRVKEHPYPDDLPRSRTRIILPFNHESESPDYVEHLVPQAEAHARISDRLTNLNMTSLLFTRNIREIRWEIDGRSGRYFREDSVSVNDMRRLTTISDGEHVNKYLVFARVPVWRSQEFKPVEIAIVLDTKDQRALIDSALYVLFPTEQETRLNFILNGPYRTNPSRETISEEDHFNVHLMKETCALMKEVLPQMRDMGLLTVQFLSILPNTNDLIREFYAPLRDIIFQSFKEDALTPTRSGSHAPATGLFRGPAKIAEVLDDDDVAFFTGYGTPLWAANPPPQYQRAERFLDDLKINSWGWREFCEALDQRNDDRGSRIEGWLAEKDDDWVMRLYALLGEAFYTYGMRVSAHDLRIVRVDAGHSQEHVTPHESFFPPEPGVTPPQDIRFVKPTVYDTGRSESQKRYATAFLNYIGVHDFGAEEAIKLRLAPYLNPPKQIGDGHYKDLEQFIAYWIDNPSDAELFASHTFLIGTTADGDLYWRKPADLCLDNPYIETGLAGWAQIHHKNSVWKGYLDELGKSRTKDFIEFLKDAGVMHKLEVVACESIDGHPYEKWWKNNCFDGRCVKQTHTAISEDYTIQDIKKYLTPPSVLAARLVWTALISASADSGKARFSPNQKYRPREEDSRFVYYLKRDAWIPDKSGAFRKPEAMTRDDLLPDFPYDDRNGLLTRIGFGENAKKRSEEYVSRSNYAKSLNFEDAEEADKMADIAKLLRANGRSPDELIAQISGVSSPNAPQFPTRTVANSHRRQDRLAEQLADSPVKEYEDRKRKVRTSRGAVDPTIWLRENYTNDDGQIVCQICKKEPFKKRNGKHYIEAVEALSRDHFPLEREEQFLALCPLCAAMYKEYVKEDDDAMVALRDSMINASSLEIPLRLGDLDTSIRFVETHFSDIRTILRDIE